MDKIWKANKNISGLQKRATDTECRAAGTALANIMQFDAALTTIKTSFDKFMLEVLGNMESELRPLLLVI
jgi:hypothetical protein